MATGRIQMAVRIRTVAIPVNGLGTRLLPFMLATPKKLQGALPALEASAA
jgi:UTP-glucose-1-phosphate uridylyltransferase